MVYALLPDGAWTVIMDISNEIRYVTKVSAMN